jgi:hypothetical protein
MFTHKMKVRMVATAVTMVLGVTGQVVAGIIIDNADDFSKTDAHSGTAIAGRANVNECGIDQLAPTNVNEFQPAGDWNNVELTYDAQTMVTGGTHFTAITFSYFVVDTEGAPGIADVVRIRDANDTLVTNAQVTSDGWRGQGDIFHWYTISVAQGAYDFSKVTLALEPQTGAFAGWWSHGIGTVQLDVVPEPASLVLLGLGALPLLRRRR